MQDYPITKELLSDFMSGFYGYGNLESPYWFIGKEEGGGKEMEENYRRVQTWEHFDKTITVDMIDYHLKLGFTEKQLNVIQQTWTKLVQILLEIDDRGSDKESRRDYQRYKLGRIDGNNCELELMPLASRSTGGAWKWGEIFSDYFGTNQRKDYFEGISIRRIERIKKLINQYKPRLVMFYSTDKLYIDKWSEITGAKDWEWVQVSRVMKYGWISKDGCLYMITTHPTMKGINSTDFSIVAQKIKSIL